MRFTQSLRSALSAAEYAEKKMSGAVPVTDFWQIHDIAFSNVKIEDGLVLEFGVYKGRTINYIAKKDKNKTVYGFDSFQGLPENWREGFNKGDFKLDKLPAVEKNVILVKGRFEETLPHFTVTKNIAYLHVDCDLYSSAKTIFRFLKDHIVEGTIIVFDEYFNYPGWQEGEFKAFQEFISETKKEYRYLTYNPQHEQVAVIITK